VALVTCAILEAAAWRAVGGINGVWDLVFGITMGEYLDLEGPIESIGVPRLMRSLRAANRSIGASAADGLRRLYVAGALEKEETEVVKALLNALGAGPHWWWFGWEREEPGFERFQDHVALAIAHHGPAALPTTVAWLDHPQATRREAACMVISRMASLRTVGDAQLTGKRVVETLRRRAEGGRNPYVRDACGSAYRLVQAAPSYLVVMVHNVSQEPVTVHIGEHSIHLVPGESGRVGPVHAGGAWISVSGVVDVAGAERLYPKGDLYARHGAAHGDAPGLWMMGVAISDRLTW
jgi:hypothetical protein